MSFLTLEHVSKTFGSTVAVSDFNLAIEQGEFVSFLGPSGCGKTTTLRMIAGFELPTSGRIVLDGEEITNKPPHQRNVGMVFQSYALFPNMTVAQNIGFGLEVRRVPSEAIKQRVAEMLALIHLEDYGERYPYQLSGGQQQRVALARALAIRPRVLLLDEPLSALDAKIRAELRLEIRRIQQALGITTVYVTHDQEEALSLSDRVVVMNRSRIEQVGAPTEIYNYPATEFVASFVGQLNVLPIEALDVQASTCRLGGQLIRLDANAPMRPITDKPRLAIRPEEFALGPAPQDDYNQIQGRVDTLIFLGAIVRMRIQLTPDIVISADLFNSRELSLPRAGDEVVLNFPRHACWLM